MKFHEGMRQSYLKAAEYAIASGKLGTGDKSDLLEMYEHLWPNAPPDIRAESLGQKKPAREWIACTHAKYCDCGGLHYSGTPEFDWLKSKGHAVHPVKENSYE